MAETKSSEFHPVLGTIEVPEEETDSELFHMALGYWKSVN